MQAFFRLSRCPICKSKASGAFGCCEVCAKILFEPFVSGDALVLGRYRGKLEQAIRAFKYHQVTRLAEVFGQGLAQELQARSWQVDSITAVPLHWKKRLIRGYNQSALVSKVLAKILNKPYETLLTRTRATKQQAKLPKEQRLSNVAGAFSAKCVRGKRVFLIDDVITTGTTIGVCREVLLKSGAKQVYLLAMAKA